MNVNLRKHWTSLLGVVFIVTAFITLFKYSVDEGWVTDAMKIGFGLLAGAGLCVGGLGLAVRKNQAVSGEIVIGLGTSLLYATFSFAGIYYEIWDSSAVLFGMIAVTAALSVYAFRFDSRLLMNIALAGGLLSPLLMRPETDQVFQLFLYLLVLNAAYFTISIAKGWSELRIVPFIGTWLMYAVYFIHFDPPMDGVWSLPERYALAAFVFYLIGFMVSSWKNNRCFDGWNLYLGLANGVFFGFWSLIILDGELHYAYVMGSMGAIYLTAGLLTYRWTGSAGSASAFPVAGGGLLLLLALSQIGSGSDAKPLVNVYLWGGIAAALIAGAKAFSKMWLHLTGVAIWLVVGIYWYIVTWDAPRGEWFGVYIPFLNSGAMAWILLAAIGFYLAVNGVVPKVTQKLESLLSNIAALLSHLIVGGLLTLQIVNAFREYAARADAMVPSLALSVVWGVYALLLFLWGAYRKQVLFRRFGSVVLAAVALKAIFLDLSGEQVLFKVMVLLALGGISFLATWINGRWNPEKETSNS